MGGRYGAGLVWLLALASISIQTLGVIVPFNQYVVQELLPARIFEQDVTWNWRLWPITGMIRFWRPWLADVAWVQGRADQLAQVKWSVLLPAAALALAALAWLIYAQSHRSAAAAMATLGAGVADDCLDTGCRLDAAPRVPGRALSS